MRSGRLETRTGMGGRRPRDCVTLGASPLDPVLRSKGRVDGVRAAGDVRWSKGWRWRLWRAPERRMSAPSPGRTATTPVVRHTDWTTGALATPAFLAAVLSRPRRVRNLALIKDCRPFLVFEAVALHTGIM